MNILDENIPKNQRQLLESWRIRIRQIGFNIGQRGMQDAEIIPYRTRNASRLARTVTNARAQGMGGGSITHSTANSAITLAKAQKPSQGWTSCCAAARQEPCGGGWVTGQPTAMASP